MKKTPSIRTRSISTEWKKKSIGEYTDVKSAARVHKDEWQEDGIPFFRTSDVMAAYNHTSNERAFISKELYDRLIARSGKLEMGDLLVTGGGSIGTPYIVPDDQPLYTKDADLLWIKKCRELDPAFLYAFYLSPGFRRYLKEISHTGTISHYTIEQIKETPVIAPDIKEQQYVGYLFQQVDRLLLLHQRKLDTLISVRKSMLQKMFPRNGSKVPEIRFKGFEGEWEEKVLGDISNEVTRVDSSSEAPVMMITAQHGFIKQSERYAYDNSGKSLTKYILLRNGELAYNHGASKLRPYGSCFALTEEQEARIPFVYHCFSVGANCPEFMAIELNGPMVENQLRMIVSSGARMDGLLNISYSEYVTVKVLVPEITEQTAISSFFREFDKVISFHQQKLDLLKRVKQSLLERMFV